MESLYKCLHFAGMKSGVVEVYMGRKKPKCKNQKKKCTCCWTYLCLNPGKCDMTQNGAAYCMHSNAFDLYDIFQHVRSTLEEKSFQK